MKNGKLPYDTKLKKKFDPAERDKKKAAAKKSALAELSKSKVSSKDIDTSILKGMASKINNESDPEKLKKLEARFEKMKKAMNNI